MSNPQDHALPTPTVPRKSLTLRIGLAALLTLAAAWGLGEWQVHRYEKELQALAQSKIETFRTPESAPYDGRIGSETVVSLPYLVFGPPTGKISIYLQYSTEENKSRIRGFDYFLVRDADATWNELESSACTAEKCQIDGKRVLADTGEAL